MICVLPSKVKLSYIHCLGKIKICALSLESKIKPHSMSWENDVICITIEK